MHSAISRIDVYKASVIRIEESCVLTQSQSITVLFCC